MHSPNFPSFILRCSSYRGRPGVCTHLRSLPPSPTLGAWLISQICLFACSPSDHPPAQLARLSLFLFAASDAERGDLKMAATPSLKVCVPTQMNKKKQDILGRSSSGRSFHSRKYPFGWKHSSLGFKCKESDL